MRLLRPQPKPPAVHTYPTNTSPACYIRTKIDAARSTSATSRYCIYGSTYAKAELSLRSFVVSKVKTDYSDRELEPQPPST